MIYQPINEESKQGWIDFLQNAKADLDGKPDMKTNNIFNTNEGDVATCKDLVGNLLALLTNQTVEIK